MFNLEKKALKYSEDMQDPSYIRSYLKGETENLEGNEGERIADFVIDKFSGGDEEVKKNLDLVARLYGGGEITMDEIDLVKSSLGDDSLNIDILGRDGDNRKAADMLMDKMEAGNSNGIIITSICKLFAGEDLDKEERARLLELISA